MISRQSSILLRWSFSTGTPTSCNWIGLEKTQEVRVVSQQPAGLCETYCHRFHNQWEVAVPGCRWEIVPAYLDGCVGKLTGSEDWVDAQ